MNVSAVAKTLFAFATCGGVLTAAGAEWPVPPPMPRRVIAPSANELGGTQLQLDDRGVKFTLFLPSG